MTYLHPSSCEYFSLLITQGSDSRDLRLSGHVGFDSLPDQLVNKCVNKGFEFNVLCIGMRCFVCVCVCVQAVGSGMLGMPDSSEVTY